MRMTGEERIAAPRTQVWEALNDPAILQQCIPGCQSLEREADGRLRGLVEIKIGPIGARFNGVVTLSDVDAPNGYTITGEGQGGTVGTAKGGAKVRLSDDGAGTLLRYEVNAEVGGRLAQLGGPIIDATAKQLAGKFFRKFGEVVGGSEDTPTVAAVGAPAAPVVSAPAQVQPPASSGFPIAWILALAFAALTGFLVGRGQGGSGSDWMGLAIGLLVIVVAAAGFAFGRWAAPVVTIDAASLARLLREGGR
ncbi:MAG: carbon monoxide dehydrogenase subunit G [Sphingobium sp.]